MMQKVARSRIFVTTYHRRGSRPIVGYWRGRILGCDKGTQGDGIGHWTGNKNDERYQLASAIHALAHSEGDAF
jgi:hypothetical protein